MRRASAAILCAALLVSLLPIGAFAQSAASPAAPAGASSGAPGPNAGSLPVPFLDLNVRSARGNQEVVLSVQLLLLLTVLAIAPSILILTTCFLRIAIVFDFIRRALSLNTSPPNQVMMGLALFLTMFIMWPTFTTIYQGSLKPFSDGKIGVQEMFTGAEKPLRTFMFNQMGNECPQRLLRSREHLVEHECPQRLLRSRNRT